MPGPVSLIDTYCPPEPVHPTLIATEPPCGVNLIALVMRLRVTCRTARSSAQMRGKSGSSCSVMRQIAALGAHRQEPAAVLHDVGQRDRLLLQLVPAGLDPRQVEDLVDQHQEMLAADVDVVGIFLVGGNAVRPEQLALHHLREAENGVERGAQLVAHGGEKAGFREVRALGPPSRLVRVELGLLEFGDERVLLRLKRDVARRGGVQALHDDEEIADHADRHGGGRQRRVLQARGPGEDHADDHRQHAGDKRGGDRRRQQRHDGRRQQHDQHGEGRRVRLAPTAGARQ